MTNTDTAIQHPQLQEFLTDAQATLAAFEQMFDELPPEHLTRKPAPNVWSITECVDHLYTTGAAYYPCIEAALQRAEAEATVSTAPFRPTWFGKLFYRFISPDRKMKVKTMPLFQPTQASTDTSIIKTFAEQQETLYDLIRRADGLNLNGTKFASPASKLVRFTIGEGLWIMVSHQQRHLNQAKGLL